MEKPIRMRGYYRALARKEKWAVDIHNLGPGSFRWLLAVAYRNVDFCDLAGELTKMRMFSIPPEEKK